MIKPFVLLTVALLLLQICDHIICQDPPTSQPSRQPTSEPSRQPSSQPSRQPVMVPSSQPSKQPSAQPSLQPTRQPSSNPSNPSSQPSAFPSNPSTEPSRLPTAQPSRQPSMQPSNQPSRLPSMQPSNQPSVQPTNQPTRLPSRQPTSQPTLQPSTRTPTSPSGQPSNYPTNWPTNFPSSQPSAYPSLPSSQPSTQPSRCPTMQPSRQPTGQPTRQPSMQPSSQPSGQPTMNPSQQPFGYPTIFPSCQPSRQPSSCPSQPSVTPSRQPSRQPSSQPSSQPSNPSSQPTKSPSRQPSRQPTRQPSAQPSSFPSNPSRQPLAPPSSQPSRQPTSNPSQPSSCPTSLPSNPTSTPTLYPSYPTSMPQAFPSSQPSSIPSLNPTSPSGQPTGSPTSPTSTPTMYPTSKPTFYSKYKNIKFPAVLDSSIISTDTSIRVSFQMSLFSVISCGIWESDLSIVITEMSFLLSSPSLVVRQTDQNLLISNLTFTNLKPLIRYDIFCHILKPSLTQLDSKQLDYADEIMKRKLTASTKCCKSIFFSAPKYSVVLTGKDYFHLSRFTFSDLPKIRVILKIHLNVSHPIDGSSTEIFGALYPSKFEFFNDSKLLPEYFISLKQYYFSAEDERNYYVYQNSSTICKNITLFDSSSQQNYTDTKCSEHTFYPENYNPSLVNEKKWFRNESVLIWMSLEGDSKEEYRVEYPEYSNYEYSSSAGANRRFVNSFRSGGRRNYFELPRGSGRQLSSAGDGDDLEENFGSFEGLEKEVGFSYPHYSRKITEPTTTMTVLLASKNGKGTDIDKEDHILSSVYPAATKFGRVHLQATISPSTAPTTSFKPTVKPSFSPTITPTVSYKPSFCPTIMPTSSVKPTTDPSLAPTPLPTVPPTFLPTAPPTRLPSSIPSSQPSFLPSSQPSATPSILPSSQPSRQPTSQPSRQPSSQPSMQPSSQPSSQPSRQPSTQPTGQPSVQPSMNPTSPSGQPSSNPTMPSGQPTKAPDFPTGQPSSFPSTPSGMPSAVPTCPSAQPSRLPSSQPSRQPSRQPSSQPSIQPSRQPTSQPSRQPSSQPSMQPSRQPSSQPSRQPSIQPSSSPSIQPSRNPTSQPSSIPTYFEYKKVDVMQPSIKILFRNFTESPKIPTLVTALYSVEGDQIILTFDHSTDGGGTPTYFECESILEFTCDENIMCKWKDIGLSEIIMYPRGDGCANVGTFVNVKDNKLRPKCIPFIGSDVDLNNECSDWGYVSHFHVPFVAPTSAKLKLPKVVLNHPGDIFSCDDIIIDVGSSTGFASRSWKSIKSVVFELHSSARVTFSQRLTDVINSETSLELLTLTIPNSEIPDYKKSYLFEITMCNFLGACSTQQTYVHRRLWSLPLLQRPASPFLSIKRISQLKLSVLQTAFNICENHYISSSWDNAENDFLWSLWEIISKTKEANEKLSISKTAENIFTVEKNTLEVGAVYHVQALAIYSDTANQGARSATPFQVSILSGNVVLVVDGGGDNDRTMQLNNSLLLDLSKSYDENKYERGSDALEFNLSCAQVWPIPDPDFTYDFVNKTVFNRPLFDYFNSNSSNSTLFMEGVVERNYTKASNNNMLYRDFVNPSSSNSSNSSSSSNSTIDPNDYFSMFYYVDETFNMTFGYNNIAGYVGWGAKSCPLSIRRKEYTPMPLAPSFPPTRIPTKATSINGPTIAPSLASALSTSPTIGKPHKGLYTVDYIDDQIEDGTIFEVYITAFDPANVERFATETVSITTLKPTNLQNSQALKIEEVPIISLSLHQKDAVVSYTSDIISTRKVNELSPFTISVSMGFHQNNSTMDPPQYQYYWDIDGGKVDAINSSFAYISDPSIVVMNNLVTQETHFNVVVLLTSGYFSQQYPFTMTVVCKSIASQGVPARTIASSTISVEVNEPPAPGNFRITPSQGTEHSTNFSFSAVLWQDVDLPFTYTFGYFDFSIDRSIELNTRSEHFRRNFRLGQGNDGEQFRLKCFVVIFDSYSANSTLNQSVIVNSSSVTGTFQWVAKNYMQKDNAFANRGTLKLIGRTTTLDKILSSVSSILSIVNKVSCLLAPNCTKLNRLPCSIIPDTCGYCKPGYPISDEPFGNSNSMCFDSITYNSAFAKLGKSCIKSQNDPCNSNILSCVANYCVLQNKTCPNRCTSVDNGACTFFKRSGSDIDRVNKCLFNDRTCEAVCICNYGYYGELCQFADQGGEFLTKTSVREQLSTKFSIVVDFYINNNEVSSAKAALNIIYSLSLRRYENSIENMRQIALMTSKLIDFFDVKKVAVHDTVIERTIISIINNIADFYSLQQMYWNLYVDSEAKYLENYDYETLFTFDSSFLRQVAADDLSTGNRNDLFINGKTNNNANFRKSYSSRKLISIDDASIFPDENKNENLVHHSRRLNHRKDNPSLSNLNYTLSNLVVNKLLAVYLNNFILVFFKPFMIETKHFVIEITYIPPDSYDEFGINTFSSNTSNFWDTPAVVLSANALNGSCFLAVVSTLPSFSMDHDKYSNGLLVAAKGDLFGNSAEYFEDPTRNRVSVDLNIVMSNTKEQNTYAHDNPTVPDYINFLCYFRDYSTRRITCRDGKSYMLSCRGHLEFLYYRCSYPISASVCGGMISVDNGLNCKVTTYTDMQTKCSCMSNPSLDEKYDAFQKFNSLYEPLPGDLLQFISTSRSAKFPVMSFTSLEYTYTRKLDMYFVSGAYLNFYTVPSGEVGRSLVYALFAFGGMCLFFAVGFDIIVLLFKRNKKEGEMIKKSRESKKLKTKQLRGETQNINIMSGLVYDFTSKGISRFMNYFNDIVSGNGNTRAEVSIFNKSLPTCLQLNLPPYTRFIREMVFHNKWLSVFFHYDKNIAQSIKIIALFTNTLANFTSAAVIFYVMDPNDQTCDVLSETSQYTCESLPSPFYTQLKGKCSWKEKYGSCRFVDPSKSVEIMVNVTVFAVIFVIPIAVLIDYIMFRVINQPLSISKQFEEVMTKSIADRNEYFRFLCSFRLFRHMSSASLRERLDREWMITHADSKSPISVKDSEWFGPGRSIQFETVSREIVFPQKVKKEIKTINTLEILENKLQNQRKDELLEYKYCRGENRDIGKRILNLFQRDIMFEYASDGTVGAFKSKIDRDDVKAKVVPLLVRLLLLAIVLLINLGMFTFLVYFVYNTTIMLQVAWMYCVACYLFFDIFIVSIAISSLQHFFIPICACSDPLLKIQGVLLTVVRKYRERFLKSDNEILAEAGIDHGNLSRKKSIIAVQKLRRQSVISVRKSTKVEHDDITEHPINESQFNTGRFFFLSLRLAETFKFLIESKIVLQYRTIWPKGLWDNFVPRRVEVDYMDINLDHFKSLKFWISSTKWIIGRCSFYLSKFNLMPIWLQDIVLQMFVNVFGAILLLSSIFLLDYHLNRLIVPLFIYYLLIHFGISLCQTKQSDINAVMKKIVSLPNDYDDKKEKEDLEALYDIFSSSEDESSDSSGDGKPFNSFINKKPIFNNNNDDDDDDVINEREITSAPENVHVTMIESKQPDIDDDALYNVDVDSSDGDELDDLRKAVMGFPRSEMNFEISSDSDSDDLKSVKSNHSRLKSNHKQHYLQDGKIQAGDDDVSDGSSDSSLDW